MAGKRRKRTYTYIRGATKPVIRFRFKVVFFIFLIITALCFVIYMMGVNLGGDEQGSYTVTWQEQEEETESSDKEDGEDSQADELSSDDAQENKKIENPVPESSAMTQTYFGKCVFVGDSITVGLSDYQLVPMKNVIAEIGMNIEKINSETMQTEYGDTTVLDALTQASPENVYIMLGSNGIAWLSIDDMIAEYSEFAQNVASALPDTNIYILSIPPVTESREQSDTPVLNENIDEYNSKLLDLANANGYHYVDVNSALKDADGKLPQDDAEDDGMHFHKSTYDKMLEYILCHVAE